MSESLRDMFVGIHFNDEASRDIDKVDRSMNNVEETTKRFGMHLGVAENNIDSFGTAGIVATRSVDRGIDDVNDNVIDLSEHLNRAGRAGITAGVAMSAALEKVEDEAEEAGHEVRQLGTTFTGVGMRAIGMGFAVTAASSGAIAAIAPVVMAVGGLASSFASAGLGAVAFGVVAVSALGQVFEASEEVAKLEEKIANADTAKERIKAQKELAAFSEGMSEGQQGALESLQGFKTFWGEFVQQFEKPIFDTFAVGLQATEKILTRLTPTITNVSDVVSEMMDEFNSSLDGEGATRFFGWLETNGAESLRSFATIGANTFSGLFGMLQAFSPIGASMEDGLVGITARFKEWGNSLGESQGFQNFISYAKENGPVLMSTLGSIGTIAKQLVADLAPFGSTVLSGLQSFTSLIVDNWGTVKALVLGLGAGFATFTVLSTVSGLMAAYQASTFASTLATQGFNAALRANPIGLVVTAVGLLVTAGIMLYQNWDTVKQKALGLWQVIQDNPILAFLAGPIGGLISAGVTIYKNWDTITANFNKFKTAITNFKLPKWVTTIGGTISNAATKVKGWFSDGPDGSHATGLANVPFDGYRAELHKNESVLTAQQSNALRSAGILRENSDGTPNLSLEPKQPEPSGNPQPNDNGLYPQNTGVQISVPLSFTINGNSADAEKIMKLISSKVPSIVHEVISDILDSELQTT